MPKTDTRLPASSQEEQANTATGVPARLSVFELRLGPRSGLTATLRQARPDAVRNHAYHDLLSNAPLIADSKEKA